MANVLHSAGPEESDWPFLALVCVDRIRSVHEAELELVGAPSSVGDARQFVAGVLDAGGVFDGSWVAAQVVSELATNAVLHAGTPFVVRVGYDDARIRISVTDLRPLARATMRRFSTEATTGRGLRMVANLSESWGVERSRGAKTVWCELHRNAATGDDSGFDHDDDLALLFLEEADSRTSGSAVDDAVPGDRPRARSRRRAVA
jgi:anti-sigma regulatory factor (Ser/Thr protein kinase)